MDSEIKRKSKWDTPTGVVEFDEHGSSLEAASAAAAKINAMLIAKGKLKLPTLTVPAAQQPPKQKINLTKTKEESIIAEVEINDVPLQCRNMLTRGSTQEEISKMSGAAVSTRGRFMSYADRAKNNMGERPLYLCVQGQNKECIDRAVQRIRSIIDESMSKQKGKGRGKSRLFGQMEPTPTLPQQPCLGTPFVSQQPLPLMSIQSSAPTSTQPIGPYIQEKVFVGLEHAHPSFNVREKILGPGGSFLQHIRAETGANIYVRGRGSGHLEPTSGREAFENLYIFITHPKLEGVLASKKLCENLIQTIHTEYSKHQSQTRTNPTPLVGMIVPASVAHQGQAILGHSSTTALIQQPNTGTIQRIQVPAVIQQTPGASQPQAHTVAINQGRTPQSASLAQQVGLAQVGNTVVGVVNSALGASIAQGNIQHAARSQSGQLVYTCTVPASTGVVYPHLQQVVPQQAAHQSPAQQAVLVQQVSIPRSVAAVPTQAAPQGVIQQQVQQHIQQHQQQQQILNAQLSAAQTVGLIHTQTASSQHSVLQGSSPVVVQQQSQQQQQIHQQIHQQLQQQKMQQEQQQQAHQIRHQQHLQQIQQQQQLQSSDASQVALCGPSLSSISTVHQEQRQKRRFREEAPDDDCKEDLLGYQHGPPHLTNVGTDSLPGIAQPMSRSSQPPPRQEAPLHPQGMSVADDTILMPPPPLSVASMVEPPPRQLDKHLMPPPLHPPAKGHRIALMDEPPQKRNKGLVSYDAGDSDEDEDIIRSPQAHTHFQPNNSPQLPVIFHRSPLSPTVHHRSPDKIEYAFQTSSGPSLRQPPPQRLIVSQGNQANQQRIAISVGQAERIGISVSQGVAMSPPQGEPTVVTHGIPQKAPSSVQHSLLGEGPQYNQQQPFWMSPH
ncbi:uncharacterized protein [Asterias amurensis]|uniref:uncharacterized protein isoform X2 n=1 Tax=Asterias amurensis TaxID=7602 RepID=UPI003AB23275